MTVRDLSGVAGAGDKARDGIHRPRAVERYHSRDIFYAFRFQPDTNPRHARRFNLEYAGRFAAGNHVERRGVVLRDVLQPEAGFAFLYALHGVVENRQVAQAEEVHFQKAEFLQRRHDVLTDDRILVFGQRDVLVHRAARNHDARRVRRRVARHAFQRARRVDEVPHFLTVAVEVGEGFRELQGVVEGDVRPGGHLFGDVVGVGVGNAHDAGHVAEYGPRRHRAERHDLRHMAFAVLPPHVLHDFPAPRVAEIHVDVGHTHALRVQEAFKIEVVLDRVNVRNAEAVGDHRPGGAPAPGADRNLYAPRVAHEVRDYQEVVGEAHAVNHVLFVLELCAVGVVAAVTLPVSGVAKLFQVGEAVVARRQLVFRQMVRPERKLNVATVGDSRRILQGVLVGREQRRHFLLAPHVKAARLVS